MGNRSHSMKRDWDRKAAEQPSGKTTGVVGWSIANFFQNNTHAIACPSIEAFFRVERPQWMDPVRASDGKKP